MDMLVLLSETNISTVIFDNHLQRCGLKPGALLFSVPLSLLRALTKACTRSFVLLHHCDLPHGALYTEKPSCLCVLMLAPLQYGLGASCCAETLQLCERSAGPLLVASIFASINAEDVATAGPTQRLLAVEARSGAVAVAHNFADDRGCITLHGASLDAATSIVLAEYNDPFLCFISDSEWCFGIVALDMCFLGALPCFCWLVSPCCEPQTRHA